MDVAEIAKAVQRRWQVAASVLLVTLVATIVVMVSAASQHQAVASLLLVAPEIVGSSSDDSETDTPSILTPGVVAEVVEGDEIRQGLDVPGGPADYEVIVTQDGTILRVEATAETEARVVPTAAAVVEAIERTVAEFVEQTGSEGDSAVILEVLSRPSLARQRTVIDESGQSRVEFVANGSVLLLTGELVRPEKGNPFSPSEGTLRVLQEVASSPSTRASVLSGKEGADYFVELDTREGAAILRVTATASTMDGTLDVLHAAIAALDGDLAERQALTGAPEASWLRLQRLYVPELATDVSGTLTRPLVTIIGLGLLAAVSLAVLADSILLARSKKRDGEEDEAGVADDDDRASPRVEQVS